MKSRKSRGGFALIEFTLIGFPIIFLTIGIIECSLAMWQYHSMSYSIEAAGRYAATHGRGCSQNGNSCTITVGDVANLISAQAPSLDPGAFNVTLKSHSTTITCNPVNTCFSNATQFPNSTDNGLNLDVTITGTYTVSNPMPLLWPGSGATSIGGLALGATSTQRIVF